MKHPFQIHSKVPILGQDFQIRGAVDPVVMIECLCGEGQHLLLTGKKVTCPECLHVYELQQVTYDLLAGTVKPIIGRSVTPAAPMLPKKIVEPS